MGIYIHIPDSYLFQKLEYFLFVQEFIQSFIAYIIQVFRQWIFCFLESIR